MKLLRRIAVLLLLLPLIVVLAPPAKAETGGYPYADYNGPGSDPGQSTWTDANGRWYSERYRHGYRNCTDFVAWKLDVSNGWYVGVPLGNAYEWKQWALARSYTVNTSPAVGSVAWWAAAPSNGNLGHVAWVESVNVTDIVVQEYNSPLGSGAFNRRTVAKNSPQGFIHFHDQAGGGGGAPPPPTFDGPTVSALSFPSGSQSVFWRGPDADLWESWYANGIWYGPVQLHMGPLGSSPAAVRVPATNHQWVFWRGTDARLWAAFYDGTWHGALLVSSSTQLDSQPTAAAHGSEINVFWRGPDKQLYEVWGNGTVWYGPIRLGMGPLGSAPTAAANAQGEQVVFWRGTDTNLWEAWYAGGHWHGPGLVPMYNLGSGPTVTIRPVNNEQDVFWRGTDNHIWQAYWNGSWHGPYKLGMGPLGSAPTATAWGSEVDVYWRGTNNNWWEAWWANNTWHGPGTVNMGPVPST